MNQIQSRDYVTKKPVLPVKHRSEFQGGEGAYLASIPENSYLVEVPIDASVALMSGKYKSINTKLDYRFYQVDLSRDPTDNDCIFRYSKAQVNESKQKKIDYNKCQSNEVYSPQPVVSSTIYENAVLNGFSQIGCQSGQSFSIEELLGNSNPGRRDYLLSISLVQTGFSKKPLYHDYVFEINREKGAGGTATFKVEDFSYTGNYKVTNLGSPSQDITTDLGFIQESFKFEAEFKK